MRKKIDDSSEIGSSKKPYKAPKLQCYGRIEKLTAGGSSMTGEKPPSMGMAATGNKAFP